MKMNRFTLALICLWNIIMPQVRLTNAQQTRIMFHNTEITFRVQLVDYEEAKMQCANDNAELVSITSKAKQLAITQHLTAIQSSSNTKYGFWTIGYRPKLSRYWFWAVCIPVRYTNWAHGQPNGLRIFSYCLYIDFSESRSMVGRWRDGECYQLKYFICEKEIRYTLSTNETRNMVMVQTTTGSQVTEAPSTTNSPSRTFNTLPLVVGVIVGTFLLIFTFIGAKKLHRHHAQASSPWRNRGFRRNRAFHKPIIATTHSEKSRTYVEPNAAPETAPRIEENPYEVIEWRGDGGYVDINFTGTEEA